MPPKKPIAKRPAPRRTKPKVDALMKRGPDSEFLDSEEEAMEPMRVAMDLPPAHASLGLYKRIAMGFVFVVALVLVVVLYVSTVEATIRIVPVEQTVRADFILDVVQTPAGATEVRGKVLSGTLGKSQSFTPSGTGQKTVEGIARGTVQIQNTSGSSQTLVKTTRLLTPEGALFRIDATVNVPAKGNVEVTAYADQPGKTGDIGPARFTIPGLPTSLQSVIYAESDAPFAGGETTVGVVSEADIAKAVETLKASVEEDAKVMLRTEAGSAFTGESFSSEIAEQTISVVAGDEASSFDVSLTLKAQGVFYDRDALQAIAVRKLFDLLEPGKEFKRVNEDGLQAVVERADEKEDRANLRVYLDGLMIPSSASSALNPGRFMGMKAEEVRTALVKEGIAKDVQVKFFPPFIGRVPRFKDHIYVEIVK